MISMSYQGYGGEQKWAATPDQRFVEEGNATNLPSLSQVFETSEQQQQNQQQQQQQNQHQSHQIDSLQMGSSSFMPMADAGFGYPSLYHHQQNFQQQNFQQNLQQQQQQLVIKQQQNQQNQQQSQQPLEHDEKCPFRTDGQPRIPRPRNAFILFRQHHHQAVLDEGNVIKTNPDVSRELGKRWRALPPEEKEYWNKQAEDEKRKHSEKYPGYRYVPRRAGRKGNCAACKARAAQKNGTNAAAASSAAASSAASAALISTPVVIAPNPLMAGMMPDMMDSQAYMEPSQFANQFNDIYSQNRMVAAPPPFYSNTMMLPPPGSQFIMNSSSSMQPFASNGSNVANVTQRVIKTENGLPPLNNWNNSRSSSSIGSNISSNIPIGSTVSLSSFPEKETDFVARDASGIVSLPRLNLEMRQNKNE